MGRSVLFSSYKSVSFKEIVPLSGDVNPAILLRMLDFPAPDGPERTTISLFTCSVARNKKCGNCFSISTNNIVILLLTIAYFFCLYLIMFFRLHQFNQSIAKNPKETMIATQNVANCVSPDSTAKYIAKGIVSVTFGINPANISVAPNSPSARANVNTIPASKPGHASGNDIVQNTRHFEAPIV